MTLQRNYSKQRMERCRWSVPTLRPRQMSDSDDDLENVWTCELGVAAVPITPADCAHCPHWSPELSGQRPKRHRH